MRSDIENTLVDSEFFWYTIHEGDQIVIGSDFYVDHELVLRRDHPYQVLSKTQSTNSNFAFIVESDITGKLVSVHPFMVDDYLISPQRPSLN